MTLVEFLEARISEDEAVARAACGVSWEPIPGANGGGWIEVSSADIRDNYAFRHLGYVGSVEHSQNLDHIVRHDPARVLAECTTKRQIVETYVPDGADPHPGQPCTNDIEGDPDGEQYADLQQWGEAGACVRHLAAWATHHHSEWVLKLLALPYADHPDFDEAWR